jgi:p-aminobenzoyl-glutamate transporter AbgT
MSPDIGSFLSQILPVLLVYLMAPIAILIVWFSLVRPYLKNGVGKMRHLL